MHATRSRAIFPVILGQLSVPSSTRLYSNGEYAFVAFIFSEEARITEIWLYIPLICDWLTLEKENKRECRTSRQLFFNYYYC
jgi:hypothetical protein